MNLLILLDDYLPSRKSMPQMMHQLAVAFAKLGHQVTIACPASEISGETEIVMEMDRIRIIRFRSGPLKNVGFIMRTINETLLPLRFRQVLRLLTGTDAPNLIVTYSPTIFYGLSLHWLKRKFRCPVYLILRDIFPQWCLDSGLLSRYSLVYWYFKFFEYLNYREATVIGVQSPGNLEYFQRLKFRSKCEILYNWYSFYGSVRQFSGLREKYNLDDKVIFFYGGNIGYAQDMGNIARLADAMKAYPEAHFLLVGNGDEFELMKNEKKSRQLDNLTLLPSVSQEEYIWILAQIDVGLLCLNPKHTTQNIPGKFLGYLAMGKPILGSVNPGNDLLTILPESHAGLISCNPDDRLFFENAVRLCCSADLRKSLGQAGKTLLQKLFSTEKAARQILRLAPKTGQLESVLNDL